MRAVMEGHVKMRDVKVDRRGLLNKVSENREKHSKDYHQACEDYCEAMILELGRVELELKNVRAGLEDDNPIPVEVYRPPFQPPQFHLKDYDAVISMLTMCVDEHIMLKADEHACYVMDDWDWKRDYELQKTVVGASFIGRG